MIHAARLLLIFLVLLAACGRKSAPAEEPGTLALRHLQAQLDSLRHHGAPLSAAPAEARPAIETLQAILAFARDSLGLNTAGQFDTIVQAQAWQVICLPLGRVQPPYGPALHRINQLRPALAPASELPMVYTLNARVARWAVEHLSDSAHGWHSSVQAVPLPILAQIGVQRLPLTAGLLEMQPGRLATYIFQALYHQQQERPRVETHCNASKAPEPIMQRRCILTTAEQAALRFTLMRYGAESVEYTNFESNLQDYNLYARAVSRHAKSAKKPLDPAVAAQHWQQAYDSLRYQINDLPFNKPELYLNHVLELERLGPAYVFSYWLYRGE